MSEELQNLTVNNLIKRLRVLQLPTTGNKAELVLLLCETGNTDEIVASLEARGQKVDEDAGSDIIPDDTEMDRRMIEVYKKEKEIPECELPVWSRELEILRD